MSAPRPRVLIVEDETLIAMLLEDFLTEIGADVAGIATSVSDAQELIAQVGPLDAATVDCQLGSEHSWPVAANLQERGVPVLFTTGAPDDPMPAQFSGAPRLGKPFTSASLRAALAPLVNLPNQPQDRA